MKKEDNFQTSTRETVTISRAEYEDKNARLASQDERISRLGNQVLVLTEALRLARHQAIWRIFREAATSLLWNS